MEGKVYGRVYAITCKVNGRVYVGGTTAPLQRRLREHIASAKDSGTPLYTDIKHYGREEFEITELATARTADMLAKLEDYHIMAYELKRIPLYNVNKYGGVGSYGKDARIKISNALKGRDLPEETKQKIKQAFGDPLVKEFHREAVIQAMQDPTVKEKMVNTKRGKTQSSETKAKRALSQAKFTIEQVNEIYLDQTTPQKTLAEMYCTAIPNISQIQTGQRFEHIIEQLLNNGNPMHPRHKARLEGRRIVNGSKKPVAQYDKDTGDLIKVWESARQASNEGGFGYGHISQCCNGKRKTHGGYVWKFYTEDINER